MDTDWATWTRVEYNTGGFEHYEVCIKKKAGEGSYGYVMRGRSMRTGESVAIKQMDIDHDGQTSNRTGQKISSWREYDIGRRISCETLVKTRAYGVDPKTGRPYLITDYIDGRPLTRAWWLFGVLCSTQVREQILLDVIVALCALHAHGYAHNDVAARNVLVTADRRGHLIDLGLVTDATLGRCKSDFLAAIDMIDRFEPIWSRPILLDCRKWVINYCARYDRAPNFAAWQQSGYFATCQWPSPATDPVVGKLLPRYADASAVVTSCLQERLLKKTDPLLAPATSTCLKRLPGAV